MKESDDNSGQRRRGQQIEQNDATFERVSAVFALRTLFDSASSQVSVQFGPARFLFFAKSRLVVVVVEFSWPPSSFCHSCPVILMLAASTTFDELSTANVIHATHYTLIG